MAAVVQPLAQVQAEQGPAPLTADQVYWRSFKNQLLVPQNGAVTSVRATTSSISPTGTDTFAVTSGSRVQIYNSRTRKLVKTISRFNVDDTARSGVLRRDGRILLAGGDSGMIQAFDTGSRAILRQWGDKRQQPVHCIRWGASLTEFMTCGDDRSVKVWDLTEDEPKWVGREHQDYVRCGTWLDGGMIVSGSYDQTVRLWDTKQERSAMTFKLSHAVEDVLALSSSLIAAAAGNTVVVLDLVAGKPDAVLRSHQKTVTCLALAQKGRLMTAGLDGHIKIHSTESWEVVASIKYADPILSLAVVASGSEERHLAVGLQSATLSIRTRIAGAEKVKVKEKEKKMQAILAGTADEYDRQKKKKDQRKGMARGRDFVGESADIVIIGNAKGPKKLSGWQKTLRAGSYGQALDQALTSRDSTQILTVITALRHRSAMRAALSGRTAGELLPVLDWLRNNIGHPRYIDAGAGMLLVILDLYSHKFADWADSHSDQRKAVNIVNKISTRVRKNVENAEKAEGVIGMISLLTGG